MFARKTYRGAAAGEAAALTRACAGARAGAGRPTVLTLARAGHRTAALAAAAVLVAAALALAGAGVLGAPASAWASTAGSAVGVTVEVPSTVEQRPGAGSDGSGGGSASLLGVNVSVPDAPAGSGSGPSAGAGKTSAATSLLGVNVEIPSTIEQRPGVGGSSSGGGSASLLGVNVSVPDPAPSDDPDSPGANTAGKTSAAFSLLGVNVEVPSTVEQRPDEGGSGGGSASVLGVDVSVPRGEFVTFYANGGQGVQMVQVAANKEVTADLGKFSWPGREIVGWYTSAACRDDEFAMAADGVLPADLAKAGGRLYAKWRVTDPRVTGSVELRLMESEAAGGNDTYISDGELASHGIDGYASDDAATADAGYPVYAGAWYPGGDGSVWPLPEDASDDDAAREGATLELPVPVMKEKKTEHGERNGVFEGWYKTCEPVYAPDGTVVRYDYRDPVEQTGEGRWSIRKFDEGTGEAGVPPYGLVLYAKWRTGAIHAFSFDATDGAFADGEKVKKVQVPDGDSASKSAVGEPVREGWAFTGWWTAPTDPRQRYAFSTPVRHPVTVYAGWEKLRYVVEFDANGGSSVGSKTVEHGEAVERPTDPTRYGYAFCGWFADSDGDGVLDETAYDFASPVTSPLTLVAKWTEEGPGPAVEHTVVFDAGKGAFEGVGDGGADVSAVEVAVAAGATADMPNPAPKRAGWQFAGWYEAAAGGAPEGWDDGGASAVPLGGKWDLASPVTGDVTLHAKWDLRLDVTVPVSVGFAVDADSLEVTTPDEGRYALKSRTVRDVTVDEVAVASEEAELGGFFDLADASEGWGPALGETTLSLRPDGAEPEVRLALADGAEAEDGESGRVWKSAYPLVDPDERAAFTIGAFSYEESGEPFDEGWRGGDPSEVLPLKLGMTISEKLRVKTALDGPRPITHLKLTVSAEGD